MAFQKGALTEIFRRRRRGLVPGAAIPLYMTHDHPLSGAQLILARIESRPRPVAGPYIVGWVAPQEGATWFYRNFQTHEAALTSFRQQQANGPPVHNDFQHDEQVNDVYRWEDRFRFKTPALDIDQMKDVVSRLSDIFNIAAPDVVYKLKKKKNTYAEAVLEENKILIYRPHLAMLLHEFAHLVNDQINQDKWAWHGPGFTRTYMSILSLFPALMQEHRLEETLKSEGIKMAAAQDVPACQHLQRVINDQFSGKPPSLIPSAR